MSRTRRNHSPDGWRTKHPGRDEKPGYKPPKAVKDCWKRCRKAKEKDAMRRGQWDAIPEFKHTDVWEWN